MKFQREGKKGERSDDRRRPRVLFYFYIHATRAWASLKSPGQLLVVAFVLRPLTLFGGWTRLSGMLAPTGLTTRV